ncbi:MAG: hypothetical protein KAT56_03760 [Sedimentisphaerales bacterium]|nr:hypothetical protein [Sedimentisphaerales bacterium]
MAKTGKTEYKMVLCTLFTLFLFLLSVVGCQPVERQSGTTVGKTLEVAQGADLQRNTEVELVEQMARYRSQYEKYLELLGDFYDRQGNNLKARWSRQELEHLQLGPKHSYLVVAEIAGAELKATTGIVEADLLYQDGMKYYHKGRGKLGVFFVNKKNLYLAIDKFNELITNYPNSDKIDDAAFQVGEIYHYYLKDYHKALLYYQRVWQWDDQTPKPARYAVARIYDDYLHDRVKALEYYQKSINMESAYPNKVEYARNRIEEISKELLKE